MKTLIVVFMLVAAAVGLPMLYTRQGLSSVFCKLSGYNCERPNNFRCGCKLTREIFGRSLQEDKCIPDTWLCDGFNDCQDGSDEVGCSCDVGQYKCGCSLQEKNCTTGAGCISEEYLCDGVRQCTDGSDELLCPCKQAEYQCGCIDGVDCISLESSPGCVDRGDRCNGCDDCPDRTDEVGCTCRISSMYQCGCDHETRQCDGGKECVYEEYMCDGNKDCKDGSDELGCNGCEFNEFCCDDGCDQCIPTEMLCDGIEQCSSGNDEKNCCHKSLFSCAARTRPNGENMLPKIVSSNYRCDGENDCGDWSDELFCAYEDMFRCHCHNISQVNCVEIAAIRSDWQCDGIVDCQEDSSDEICDCDEFNQFQCPVTGVCIDIEQRCDQTNDCGDWTDEVGCTCPPKSFTCACYANNDEITCTKYGCVDLRTKVCDGFNDCGDWSDEVGCECQSSTHLPCACYARNNITCTRDVNGCVLRSQVCDGIDQCSDGSDEMGCPCAIGQARCGCILESGKCPPNGRCIDIKRINDGFMDCEEGDDEFIFN